MSKISMSVALPNNSLEIAKILHDELGFSYLSAQQFLSKGKFGVFFTTELFLNDHAEKDRQIRAPINKLLKVKTELFRMEISIDKQWKTVSDFDQFRISTDELIAKLDRAPSEFR
jgi:hypothetical protein